MAGTLRPLPHGCVVITSEGPFTLLITAVCDGHGRPQTSGFFEAQNDPNHSHQSGDPPERAGGSRCYFNSFV